MKSLKLNKINKNKLSHHQMKNIIGGYSCGCACRWADQGGSSTMDNGMANCEANVSSPGEHQVIFHYC